MKKKIFIKIFTFVIVIFSLLLTLIHYNKNNLNFSNSKESYVKQENNSESLNIQKNEFDVITNDKDKTNGNINNSDNNLIQKPEINNVIPKEDKNINNQNNKPEEDKNTNNQNNKPKDDEKNNNGENNISKNENSNNISNEGKDQVISFYESITGGKKEFSSEQAALDRGNEILDNESRAIIDYNLNHLDEQISGDILYFRVYPSVIDKDGKTWYYLHFFCKSGEGNDDKLKSMY